MEEKSTPGMMSGTGHRVYSTREVKLREEITYLRKRLKLAETLVRYLPKNAYRQQYTDGNPRMLDIYNSWEELVKLEP